VLLQPSVSLPSHIKCITIRVASKSVNRKGIREREEFANLMAGLDNPALQTFKARKNTKGAFIPGTCFSKLIFFWRACRCHSLTILVVSPISGKGLRDHDSFDVLMG
jgi:hypothetical protein